MIRRVVGRLVTRGFGKSSCQAYLFPVRSLDIVRWSQKRTMCANIGCTWFPSRIPSFQVWRYHREIDDDASVFERVVVQLEEVEVETKRDFFKIYISLIAFLASGVVGVLIYLFRRKERFKKKTVERLVEKIDHAVSRGEVEEFIDKNFVQLLRRKEFVDVCASVLRQNLLNDEENLAIVKSLFLRYLVQNEKGIENMLRRSVREGILTDNEVADDLFKEFLVYFFSTEYGKETFKSTVIDTLADEVMVDRNRWLLSHLLDDPDLKERYETELRRALVLYVLQSKEISDTVKEQMKFLLDEIKNAE